nr:midasin-like isoform X4 [Ipomoea trifida]
MEAMSEKPRCNGGDNKGKKNTTKVELSLGKNGGIFILLGGALVTALISSAFRKPRKPRGGSPLKSTAAAEENGEAAGDERKKNIIDDEDPVRKGLQFILSDPSSLMQGHLRIKDDGEGDYNVRKEIYETTEKEERSVKIQAIEEHDSPANSCHQEISSNGSSIPGSVSSIQFDQIFSVQRIKDDGEGDYNATKEIYETTEKQERTLKIQAIEEQDSPANGCHQEIISNGSSIPGSATSSEQEYSSHPFYTEALGEEMECSEKNCSPEIESDLCDGQDAMYSSPEIQGNDDQNTNSEQVTSEITHPEDYEKELGQYSSLDNEGEEVAVNDEEETNQKIEKTLREDDTATAKQHPILPSNDNEGEMEESSEGVMISSDESDDDVVIWPAEPALPTPLMGLKGPKEETEDDRTLKTEAHINLKTINNSQLLTGTVTLLIAYSCFCYFELPYLKPSLVVIAAMFLSKSENIFSRVVRGNSGTRIPRESNPPPPPLCNARLKSQWLLSVHGSASVQIAVLEHDGGVAKNEVHRAVDVTFPEKLAAGMNVEGVLVAHKAAVVEDRVVGVRPDCHSLVLLRSRIVFESVETGVLVSHGGAEERLQVGVAFRRGILETVEDRPEIRQRVGEQFPADVESTILHLSQAGNRPPDTAAVIGGRYNLRHGDVHGGGDDFG